MNAINEDIEAGNVNVLLFDGELVGTGCFANNHITRVYVLPKHQGKRYGTFIMNQLEKVICRNYNKAILDASLPAARLYEKLNFPSFVVKPIKLMYNIIGAFLRTKSI